jgi:hypothetical protein
MTDPHHHDQHTMATNLTNIPIDEIRALVDERARYEGWIGALESRRGQTPPHVYDRVRGDYDGRLGKVMERLGTFVSALREGESALARREDELHRSIGERHDELSEIELRTAVGEYESDEGERLRSEKQGEVQGLEADRAGVQEDLTTLRDLLGRSLPAGEQPPARTPTPAASQPAVGQPTSAQPVALAGAGVDALGAADEPWPAGSAVDQSGAAPATESAATEVARPEYEEWTEGTPATATAAAATGASASASASASAAEPRPQGGAAPPATFPAAGMPDQEKTLRCPDCGAMNYPTEWYCEKCGGELAAL